MAAASSEAGTTCSPAATAVRLPSWYCLRQRNNWLADLQFEQIRLVSYATTNAIAVKTASPKSTGGQVKSQVPTNAGTASTTKDTLPTYDGEVK